MGSHLPVQGTWVRSPVREAPTCHRHHSYWSPHALGPVLHNKRNRCNREPEHQDGQWPLLATARKSPHSNQAQRSQRLTKQICFLKNLRSEKTKQACEPDSNMAQILKLANGSFLEQRQIGWWFEWDKMNNTQEQTGNLSRDGNSKKESKGNPRNQNYCRELSASSGSSGDCGTRPGTDSASLKTHQWKPPKLKCREDKEGKRKRTSSNCGTVPKDLTFVQLDHQKEKERGGKKKYLK